MQTTNLKTPTTTPTANTTAGTIQRGDTAARLEAMETKIDLVLKWQKQTRRMAIVRAIIDFVFLFIFIILPILGGIYLFSYINDKFDLQKVGAQFTEFQDNIENLRQKSDQLDGITDNLDIRNFIQ